MKRFMLVVLMVLIGSGFVGGIMACQDDKASPPAKEETSPKEENAPAPEKPSP